MNPCSTVTAGRVRIGKLFEPCTDGGIQPLDVLLMNADHVFRLNVTSHLSQSDLERFGTKICDLFSPDAQSKVDGAQGSTPKKPHWQSSHRAPVLLIRLCFEVKAAAAYCIAVSRWYLQIKTDLHAT